MPATRRTLRTRLPLRLSRLAAVFLLAPLAGCWQPGGQMMSLDMFTYESHSWQPQTITLMDTRTGQAVWSVDVPVGQEVVFRFHPEEGDKVEGMDKPSPIYPDRMKWDLWPAGQRWGDPQRVMSVPSKEHRRVDVRLRAVPELPPEMLGKTADPPGPKMTPAPPPAPTPPPATTPPAPSAPTKPSEPAAAEPAKPAEPVKPADPTAPPVDMPKH